MPVLRVDHVGRLGIITDQTPCEMPPEAWSGGYNVRFKGDWVEKSMCYMDAFQAVDGNSTTITPAYLMYDLNGSTGYWYLLNSGSAADYLITAFDGNTTYTDITHTSGMTASLYSRWNGGLIGGVPIFNPGGEDYPVYWDHDEENPCEYLPFNATTDWSDADLPGTSNTGIMAKVIRPFKQHLIALNLAYPTSADTGYYPHSVLWSHPADPGTVPASWDWSDPTVDAGMTDLAETGGYLVDMIPLRDIGIIYKNRSIYGMQYVGQPYIFKFYKISDSIGLLAQDCAVEFEGKHFAVGLSDIYIHDGQSITSVASNKVKDAIFGSLDQSNYKVSHCVMNRERHEIWFCYPEIGNSYCTKAAVWNWDTEAWTFINLPNVAHTATGTYAVEDTWDSDNQSWDLDADPWDINKIVSDRIMMSSSGAPSILQADASYFCSTGASVGFSGWPWGFGHGSSGLGYVNRAWLERIGITLVGRDRFGNPQVDPSSRKVLRRVWPRFDGETGETVNVYVGSQEHVDDAVKWKGPYIFTIGQSDKIDCLVHGRLLAIRFETVGALKWRLQGYSLDLDLTSRY